MMKFAAAAKIALHRTGALAAYHRWRNCRTLTVLMFHRVLPAADLERSGADPEWTVTAELFDEILAFLPRHYNLVGLGDVLAARSGRTKLPPRALLVSFDDGWRDNLEHALPILCRRGVPAVLFAASDAIEDAGVCWWQEVLLWALRSGRAGAAELARRAALAPAPERAGGSPELDLLVGYAALSAARREEALRPLTQELAALQTAPHMLDAVSLGALAAGGIAVGIHGAAHLPLTALADPAGDLERARAQLAALVGKPAAGAMSFPHGRYDARVLACVRKLGFAALFTSDAIINSCPGGSLGSDLVGRTPLFAHLVMRENRHLARERLAAFLFLRPVAVVRG